MGDGDGRGRFSGLGGGDCAGQGKVEEGGEGGGGGEEEGRMRERGKESSHQSVCSTYAFHTFTEFTTSTQQLTTALYNLENIVSFGNVAKVFCLRWISKNRYEYRKTKVLFNCSFVEALDSRKRSFSRFFAWVTVYCR